ncbi:hypothetical protein EJV47_17165 [Hymenobacter gummosus]|uniref:SH3 domain-containing protein n=1 Tax=Hymenobacter gummosus TaxID=1776032 RepID=A0A431TZL1_9BACT|nr:hypothetical protein [Hymenobacter gummosus]RTQ48161.1 hypothetical protein EJV47_17165 [Hymenobacter gummosus]
MPNFPAKKIAILCLLAGFFIQAVLAQPTSLTARRADSLFTVGKPAEAYQQYRQQLRQRVVSEQALLRMAAVQESHDQYPAALYYLNLYQHYYPNAAVWRKTVELAATHRLTGYPDTWRQQLALTFRRYYPSLLQVLLAVGVAAGTLLMLRRRGAARGWWLVYGIYLVLVGAVLNVLEPATVGLVCRPRAALMAAPSAAAGWLTTAAAGDRLLVQGRQDIWFRVLWRGRTAYIRQHDLLLVE